MSSFLIFICPILILIYAVNSWMHNDKLTSSEHKNFRIGFAVRSRCLVECLVRRLGN